MEGELAEEALASLVAQSEDDEVVRTGLFRERLDDVVRLDELCIGSSIGLFFGKHPKLPFELGLFVSRQALLRHLNEVNVRKACAA